MYCSVWVLFLLASLATSIHGHSQQFIFSDHLKIDSVAEITPNGSVVPFDSTGLRKGQVFHAQPFQFKNSQTNTPFSFSTSFVFSLNLQFPVVLSEGISLVISASKWLPQHMPSQYVGLSNKTQEENILESPSLIEITLKISSDLRGIENNHVGININGVTLAKYSPLGYYDHFNEKLRKLELTRGKMVQVWIEYDAIEKELHISVSPVSVPKPNRPLFSFPLDIAPYVSENMYVGISTSSSMDMFGWSFKMNGKAQGFDHLQMGKFTPRIEGFQVSNTWTFIEMSCPCITKLLRNVSEEFKMFNGSSQCLKRLFEQCRQ